MLFKHSIGIVGGAGPHAGAYAFHSLLKEAHRMGAYADHEYPEVLVHSVPFVSFDTTGVTDGASVQCQIMSSLRTLERAGVKLALIACNSSHEFFDALKTSTSVRLVSLVAAAQVSIERSSATRFAALSSASARTAGLFRAVTEGAGKTFVELSDEQQGRVNELIGECMNGQYSIKLMSDLTSIATQLKGDGVQQLLIGCTELSWLASHCSLPLPAVDSLEEATRALLLLSAKCAPIPA
jgi:aspartate racemase